ncbi:MAG: hypothetical protein D6741_10240 [Planctomycetota bacterium]|nr:MAG: hypothetical protein D6741_10240 [Planctomycetota bacterium]
MMNDSPRRIDRSKSELRRFAETVVGPGCRTGSVSERRAAVRLPALGKHRTCNCGSTGKGCQRSDDLSANRASKPAPSEK